MQNSWSGKRGSNPRHMPWQGIALSTELFPHKASIIIAKINKKVNKFLQYFKIDVINNFI